ncbi:MAG: hypothetical protein WCW64_00870 [Phycisphaerae bacterium]|jgi:hypothetical protein
MTQKNKEQNKTMTVVGLKQLLIALGKEVETDFEVWLSSDEEGNEFLPMFENPELCLAIDKDAKRVIFYPSHR